MDSVAVKEKLSLREREDAMGAYLMMFAATAVGLPLPFLNIVASVIYFAVNGDKSTFVRYHALQSLYSQIVVSLFNAFAVIWAVRHLIFGHHHGMEWVAWAWALGVLNLIYLVFSIVAAVQSRRGETPRWIIFGWLAWRGSYGLETRA
jgi:uncharacterized membrane protein